MGGSALKSLDIKRMSREEYEVAVYAIRVGLAQHGLDSYEVPAYKTKEDFGDADIVVYNPKGINLTELVETIFHPSEIVVNGNVISFDHHAHQIDLIQFSDFDTLEFAHGYFSWNDLGNFMGRVSRRLGMKFGHDGLWYVLRDPENPDYVFKEIRIRSDFLDVLKFLGYDPIRWNDGFDTPEDIYNFVTTSKYFHPAGFVLSNRNYTARIRDKKRKMYNGLITFLSEKYGITEDTPLPEDYYQKEHGLKKALVKFPEFAQEYFKAKSDMEIHKRYMSRINGKWAAEHFDVQGKSLGVIMKNLKDYIHKHNLKEWASNEDPEIVRQFVDVLKNNGVLDGEETRKTRSDSDGSIN